VIDIFAWIVLLILVASAIAIFFIAGSLPGHIAKSRGHPWATAVTVAGWVTLICGFVLWPPTPAALSTFNSDRLMSTSSRASFLGQNITSSRPSSSPPPDGYVTNVGLLKGARVANLPLSPVMAFISTTETVVGVQIQQIYTRYIEPGQEVEVTFKFFPGQVFPGKVVSVLAATSTGQVLTSGTAVAPTQVTAAPFVVRVKLDDAKLAASLPAGTAGDAAIYTPHIKPAHVIRKVILRQIAILNYVNPF
jgi:hypothetical protein